MKKTLLIAAVASAALVSCSKDQVVEVQQDEIKFSVVADNATKAAHVYGSNVLMSSFTVCADYGSNIYIEGDEMTVEKDGEGNTTVSNASNVKRYWPDLISTTMDFYAVADSDSDGNGSTYKAMNNRDAAGAPTVDFLVNETVAYQKDFVYAVKAGVGSKENVALNFRHALSLIEFQAKCSNTALKVTIKGVKVGNVKKAGTFTLPTSTTVNRIDEGSDDINKEDPAVGTAGSWTATTDITNGTKHAYLVDLTASPVLLTTEVQPLTYRNPSATSAPNNSMILLPQTLNSPWVPTPADPSTVISTTTLTYLGVNCVICNNDESNTQLYSGWAYMPLGYTPQDSSDEELAKVPVWLPGKKYVYTFDFGTGNGGYDEDGNPVLTPIAYTLTIDDFDAFTGGNSDVDMK